MSKRLAVAAVALLVLGLGPPPLDIEMGPRPYVAASLSGGCFFKMSPDPADPTDPAKGLGFAYKASVGQADELLWQTSGWYAHTVFISDDGAYLVRLGNWPRGDRPKASDLAVAFYKSGELIKTYATADLIKDPSKGMKSASHYTFLSEPPPDFVERNVFLSEAFTFRLRTADSIEYLFDVSTGEVISAEQR